jgi:hypothetical protein
VSEATGGRLFVLDLSGGRILSLNPDGADLRVIVTGCRHPDGIVVDVESGHIYWTDMGVPHLNDGCIERADLNGQNHKTIIPEGGTFTPKQLYLDKKNGKLYWSDREGMRVMRSNLDGSNIETLVQTGQGVSDRSDATKWCIGITVDVERGQMYWTQKGPDKAGRGRIFRATTEIPDGQVLPTALISKSCLRVCPSQLTLISILRDVCYIGRIVVILRVVILCIVPQWMWIRIGKDKRQRFFLHI